MVLTEVRSDLSRRTRRRTSVQHLDSDSFIQSRVNGIKMQWRTTCKIDRPLEQVVSEQEFIDEKWDSSRTRRAKKALERELRQVR